MGIRDAIAGAFRRFLGIRALGERLEEVEERLEQIQQTQLELKKGLRAQEKSPLLQVDRYLKARKKVEREIPYHAYLKAGRETVELIEQRMVGVPIFEGRGKLLAHGVKIADKDGLFLEFGVARGESITFIANHTEATVHGFDSFEGLPEGMVELPKGYASVGGQLPEVPDKSSRQKVCK